MFIPKKRNPLRETLSVSRTCERPGLPRGVQTSVNLEDCVLREVVMLSSGSPVSFYRKRKSQLVGSLCGRGLTVSPVDSRFPAPSPLRLKCRIVGSLFVFVLFTKYTSDRGDYSDLTF